MAALKDRAKGYENNPEKLPPPSFNIQDKALLTTIGKEIKQIYIANDSQWQDHLGLAIAVSFNNNIFSYLVNLS